jgi:hypothetical protein
MSQILSMAARLQEAENTISELRSQLRAQRLTTPINTFIPEDSITGDTPLPQPSPTQSPSPDEELATDLSVDGKGQVCT